MGISNRNSVLAVTLETTEGVPVLPTSAADYIGIQGDFAITPGFDVLKNDELTPSLGMRKSILGAQKPTAGGSHYARASGVAGQAPDWRLWLLAAFGTEVVASTEYATAASSTVSVVKVPSGDGAHFERGQAVLVKDPVNGWSLRAIDSVSGDNLTLGFDLPAAPGTGVNLGKCVLYKPAQVGHPTLTFTHYVGNGGAVQMASGVRVTKLDIKAQAGQLINATFGFDGLEFYLNPVTVTDSTRYVDFTDDGATLAAAVAAGTYEDPNDLCEAVQTAMNASGTTQTYTVSYDSTTGKFTIKGTGTLLSLLFATGTNAANTIATVLGFTATDKTGAAATTGYTSATALSLASPYTPTLDNADPVAAKSNEVLIASATDTVSFRPSDLTLSLTDTRTEIKDVTAPSGVSGSQITGREAKVTGKSLLSKFDVSKFTAFRENQDVKFQWSWGPKLGGNLAEGKACYVYLPTITITSWKLSSDNGLVVLEFEGTAFVDAEGSGEIYAGFN